MHYLDETHILLFLVQVFTLMVCARGFGELLRRWKQPALTAEILVGILLGPTIMGRFLPEFQQTIFPPEAIQQAMLDTLAWFGVLFLLLDTGLEIDFSIAWRQRSSALAIVLVQISYGPAPLEPQALFNWLIEHQQWESPPRPDYIDMANKRLSDAWDNPIVTIAFNGKLVGLGSCGSNGIWEKGKNDDLVQYFDVFELPEATGTDPEE